MLARMRSIAQPAHASTPFSISKFLRSEFHSAHALGNEALAPAQPLDSRPEVLNGRRLIETTAEPGSA